MVSIGVAALFSFGMVSSSLAQAGDPTTINLVPASKKDTIAPKSGAEVFDPDGLMYADYTQDNVSVSPFKLKAVIGQESVEAVFPEFQIHQEPWIVVDPIGCMDDDPSTECHPMEIAQYFGGTEDVPVTVRPLKGKGEFRHRAKATLKVEVTLVDGKVTTIDGLVRIGNPNGADYGVLFRGHIN
jgi:hypothetical protein